MSSGESQRKIVARVRRKMVWVTGGPVSWGTNPDSATGFGSSVNTQQTESTSSDATRNAPRSLEEALADMEARPSDGWWDYAEPTPREVPFDIEIEIQDDGGCLLIAYSSVDGSFWGDTWYASQDDAEESALEKYGVQADEWQKQQ